MGGLLWQSLQFLKKFLLNLKKSLTNIYGHAILYRYLKFAVLAQ